MAFMKTLLLLRHAKSSLIDPTLSDSMRPLTYQGKQDVYIIGNLLKNKKLIPDIIICSNAKRAVDTSKLIAEYLNYHDEIHLSKLLYQTTAKDYINVVSEIPDKNNMVLLVGHNPILENLVEIITNELRIMKTCSLAHIVLPIKKWVEIKTWTKGKLIELFDIKSLE
jgi:phosphohistidine phosphatase